MKLYIFLCMNINERKIELVYVIVYLFFHNLNSDKKREAGYIIKNALAGFN